MHLPAPTKSAYAARKEDDYQRIERLMRSVGTMGCLRALWINEQKVIKRWPPEWVERITEEKDRAKSRLEGNDAV